MSHTQPTPVPPFPGSEPPAAKRAKPWYKKWWVWVLAIIVLIGAANAIGGGSGTPQATQTTASTGDGGSAAASAPASEPTTEPTKERLTVDDGWEIDKSNGFAVYVTGYVTNNSDRPIETYVQITFDALDANGANLGTCLDNTNTIDAGGKWKFKAICLDNADEIETVRFKELTGF